MSAQDRKVQNKFKFGGVTFSITTDDADNPTSLVTMQRLVALIQNIEPLIGRGVCDAAPTQSTYDSLTTARAVYNGLCKIANNLDNLGIVTLPVMHNVFYGARTSRYSGTDGIIKAAYANKVYYNTSSNKLCYHTSVGGDGGDYRPQYGRLYYNVGIAPNTSSATGNVSESEFPIGWYLWNGSKLTKITVSD